MKKVIVVSGAILVVLIVATLLLANLGKKNKDKKPTSSYPKVDSNRSLSSLNEDEKKTLLSLKSRLPYYGHKFSLTYSNRLGKLVVHNQLNNSDEEFKNWLKNQDKKTSAMISNHANLIIFTHQSATTKRNSQGKLYAPISKEKYREIQIKSLMDIVRGFMGIGDTDIPNKQATNSSRL